MKRYFVEFYKPTDKQFLKMWNECIFIFDANVLLNLYRYPQKTTKILLPIIEGVKDRVWLPYQAGVEYQRSRLKVIDAQKNVYGLVNGLVEKTLDKLVSEIKQYGRHPFLDGKNICDKVVDAKEKLEKEVSKIEDKHPNWEEKDYIRTKLDKIFLGRVGDSFTSEELEKIYSEGKDRYSKQVPPGYKDKNKDSTDPSEIKKYGDLVIWKEMLRYATASKKPIIFVTDDQKEDWWWKVSGKEVGPRHELIKEMKEVASVDFYMQQSAQFMRFAGKLESDDEVIEDIRKVQKNRIFFINEKGNFELSDSDSVDDSISGNLIKFKNFGAGETDETTGDDGGEQDINIS